VRRSHQAKVGNSAACRLQIEAAWTYASQPGSAVSRGSGRRSSPGRSARSPGKRSCDRQREAPATVTAAIARERAGFVALAASYCGWSPAAQRLRYRPVRAAGRRAKRCAMPSSTRASEYDQPIARGPNRTVWKACAALGDVRRDTLWACSRDVNQRRRLPAGPGVNPGASHPVALRATLPCSEQKGSDEPPQLALELAPAWQHAPKRPL